MKTRLPRSMLMALAIVSAVALAAAGCAGDDPTPTVTRAPLTPDPAEGERLFLANGCSSCHGRDGMGTGAGPALPGHTAEQVRRQVRNPVGGRMPQYTVDRISDEELEHIVAFIESLESGDGHMHGMDEPASEVVLMHARMALVAIQAGDTAEADHHLGHAIEAANDRAPASLRAAQDALGRTDLHAAEHEIEEFVGESDVTSGLGRLHLELTLAGIAVGDLPDARHHLDHFIEAETAPALVELAEDALAHIDRGELHEAEHVVQDLIGEQAHHHD